MVSTKMPDYYTISLNHITGKNLITPEEQNQDHRCIACANLIIRQILKDFKYGKRKNGILPNPQNGKIILHKPAIKGRH